jgi:hypothetical protein
LTNPHDILLGISSEIASRKGAKSAKKDKKNKMLLFFFALFAPLREAIF